MRFCGRTRFIPASIICRLRGRTYTRKPLTEPRYGEKFSTGTPTSSSASAPHSDDTAATPAALAPASMRPVAISAKRKKGVGLGFSKPSIHDAPKAQLLGHHSLIHDFYTRNALSHPHPEVPGISRKKVGATSGNRGIENWPVFFCKFQRR